MLNRDSFRDALNRWPVDEILPSFLQKESSLATGLLPQTNSSSPDLHDSQSHTPSFWRRYFAGWRFGVLRSALTASCAFLFMLLLTVGLQIGLPIRKGGATITQGNCSVIKAAQILIHLALNILSTMVLGASNYCMQGLCAPTRSEVDRAHARRRWLDVGSQSLRNLRAIKLERSLTWIFLIITSLPLHLVFNSVFFLTKQANQYAVAVVSQDFFNTTNWEPTKKNSSPSLFEVESNAEAVYFRKDEEVVPRLLRDARNLYRNPNNFTTISSTDCIKKYAAGFLQDVGNVVVVTNEHNVTDPLLWSRYPERYNYNGHDNTNIYGWTCQDFPHYSPNSCNKDKALQMTNNGHNWTVHGYQVAHCLGQRVENQCELNFNIWLAIMVVVCSGFQTIAMWVLVWKAYQSHEETLKTMGDAIASFLEREDTTTTGMCLATEYDLARDGWKEDCEPREFKMTTTSSWSSGVGRLQWWSSHLFATGFAVLIALSLVFSLIGSHSSNIRSTLGEPDIQSLFSITDNTNGSSTIVPSIIVANLPQLVFSSVYLSYNSLFTRMLIGREWSRFTVRHKQLRVSSSPRGLQKSSRMLSIPGKYALALMGFASIVHWLISQSLFFVRIEGIDGLGVTDMEDTIAKLGYSSQGITLVLVFLVIASLTSLAFGRWRRLAGGIPSGGSNSAIISAACHPPAGERTPWLRKVKWGEVYNGGDETDLAVGHCSFSSGMVLQPIAGKEYL